MEVLAGLGVFLLGLALLFVAVSALISVTSGGQVVGTPAHLYPKIIKLAHLTPGERFVELGSGSGNLLQEFAQATGAQAIGIEISPFMYLVSTWRTRKNPLVHITLQSIHRYNVRSADAIYCYLLPGTMYRLEEKFERELSAGTRVISYAFPLLKKKPSRIIPDGKEYGSLYLYEY